MAGEKGNLNSSKKLSSNSLFKSRKYGDQDWSVISQRLYFMNTNPNKIYRCAKQCREHWNCYLNPNLKKGPWTKE